MLWCAGVCKSWREMCKKIVQSTESSGEITFSTSLMEPGPCNGTIQCYIKRDKSNQTFHLYSSLSPALLAENGKFILSAKRTCKATCTEYVISMDANNISSSSSTYIGKLRSNFTRTSYIVYDTQSPHNNAQLSPPGGSNSKKYSPKFSTGSYNIEQVKYSHCQVMKADHCFFRTKPQYGMER